MLALVANASVGITGDRQIKDGTCQNLTSAYVLHDTKGKGSL